MATSKRWWQDPISKVTIWETPLSSGKGVFYFLYLDVKQSSDAIAKYVKSLIEDNATDLRKVYIKSGAKAYQISFSFTDNKEADPIATDRMLELISEYLKNIGYDDTKNASVSKKGKKASGKYKPTPAPAPITVTDLLFERFGLKVGDYFVTMLKPSPIYKISKYDPKKDEATISYYVNESKSELTYIVSRLGQKEWEKFEPKVGDVYSSKSIGQSKYNVRTTITSIDEDGYVSYNLEVDGDASVAEVSKPLFITGAYDNGYVLEENIPAVRPDDLLMKKFGLKEGDYFTAISPLPIYKVNKYDPAKDEAEITWYDKSKFIETKMSVAGISVSVWEKFQPQVGDVYSSRKFGTDKIYIKEFDGENYKYKRGNSTSLYIMEKSLFLKEAYDFEYELVSRDVIISTPDPLMEKFGLKLGDYFYAKGTSAPIYKIAQYYPDKDEVVATWFDGGKEKTGVRQKISNTKNWTKFEPAAGDVYRGDNIGGNKFTVTVTKIEDDKVGYNFIDEFNLEVPGSISMGDFLQNAYKNQYYIVSKAGGNKSSYETTEEALGLKIGDFYIVSGNPKPVYSLQAYDEKTGMIRSTYYDGYEVKEVTADLQYVAPGAWKKVDPKVGDTLEKNNGEYGYIESITNGVFDVRFPKGIVDIAKSDLGFLIYKGYYKIKDTGGASVKLQLSDFKRGAYFVEKKKPSLIYKVNSQVFPDDIGISADTKKPSEFGGGNVVKYKFLLNEFDKLEILKFKAGQVFELKTRKTPSKSAVNNLVEIVSFNEASDEVEVRETLLGANKSQNTTMRTASDLYDLLWLGGYTLLTDRGAGSDAKPDTKSFAKIPVASDFVPGVIFATRRLPSLIYKTIFINDGTTIESVAMEPSRNGDGAGNTHKFLTSEVNQLQIIEPVAGQFFEKSFTDKKGKFSDKLEVVKVDNVNSRVEIKEVFSPAIAGATQKEGAGTISVFKQNIWQQGFKYTKAPSAPATSDSDVQQKRDYTRFKSGRICVLQGADYDYPKRLYKVVHAPTSDSDMVVASYRIGFKSETMSEQTEGFYGDTKKDGLEVFTPAPGQVFYRVDKVIENGVDTLRLKEISIEFVSIDKATNFVDFKVVESYPDTGDATAYREMRSVDGLVEDLWKDGFNLKEENKISDTDKEKSFAPFYDELEEVKKSISELLEIRSTINDIQFEEKVEINNLIAKKQAEANRIIAKRLEERLGSTKMIDDLFEQSFLPLKSRYNEAIKQNEKIELVAPNGETSDLNEGQQEIVNSSSFEDWFGDFKTAYLYRNLSDNGGIGVSKVLSKKHEPLIVYHGTNMPFSYFMFDKFPAAYFAERKEYSEYFATGRGGGDGYVIPFFLNIRNPLDLSRFGIEEVSVDDFFDEVFLQTGLSKEDFQLNPAFSNSKLPPMWAWAYLRNNPGMLKKLAETKIVDGIVFYENNPAIADKSSLAYQTKAYIVFSPHQIKIADPDRGGVLLASLKSFMLKKGGIL